MVRPGFARTIFVGDRATIPAATGYPTVREPAGDQPGGDQLSAYMRGVRSRVELARRLLGALAPDTGGQSVVVVGSGDGSECLWLAHEDQALVTGIDVSAKETIAPELAGALERVVGEAGSGQRASGLVELRTQDICQPVLDGASVDRVYSWQTFEHVMNPGAALGEIARLLRPGGAAFIEYNPFYSIDGAHWAGTIDIPWAHVRLDDDAFERTLETLHPDRPEYAARFVREFINRMTQHDLQEHAREAGLEVVEMLPRVRTEDALVLTSAILDQARARYPGVRPIDLLCRIVRVVLRKPE